MDPVFPSRVAHQRLLIGTTMLNSGTGLTNGLSSGQTINAGHARTAQSPSRTVSSQDKTMVTSGDSRREVRANKEVSILVQ